MFGIGGWELVIIAVLALLLFGPDKLPTLARTVGRFMRDFKRYQDMMESTIRAEIYTADLQKEPKRDPFKTGKEFREKVQSTGAAKPADEDAAEAVETPVDDAAETPADAADDAHDAADTPVDDAAETPADAADTAHDAADEPAEAGEEVAEPGA